RAPPKPSWRGRGPSGQAGLPSKTPGASTSMKLSQLAVQRLGWFMVVGAFFGARDMCAGNGGPPPRPTAPEDAVPSDAGDDATIGLAPTLPVAPARHHVERTLAHL